MKKTFLISIFLISINAFGQNKKPIETKKVSDSVTVDTLYQLTMSKQELSNIVNAIKSIDEKPSIINRWLEQNLFNKIKIVTFKK